MKTPCWRCCIATTQTHPDIPALCDQCSAVPRIRNLYVEHLEQLTREADVSISKLKAEVAKIHQDSRYNRLIAQADQIRAEARNNPEFRAILIRDYGWTEEFLCGD